MCETPACARNATLPGPLWRRRRAPDPPSVLTFRMRILPACQTSPWVAPSVLCLHCLRRRCVVKRQDERALCGCVVRKWAGHAVQERNTGHARHADCISSGWARMRSTPALMAGAGRQCWCWVCVRSAMPYPAAATTPPHASCPPSTPAATPVLLLSLATALPPAQWAASPPSSQRYPLAPARQRHPHRPCRMSHSPRSGLHVTRAPPCAQRRTLALTHLARSAARGYHGPDHAVSEPLQLGHVGQGARPHRQERGNTWLACTCPRLGPCALVHRQLELQRRHPPSGHTAGLLGQSCAAPARCTPVRSGRNVRALVSRSGNAAINRAPRTPNSTHPSPHGEAALRQQLQSTPRGVVCSVWRSAGFALPIYFRLCCAWRGRGRQQGAGDGAVGAPPQNSRGAPSSGIHDPLYAWCAPWPPLGAPGALAGRAAAPAPATQTRGAPRQQGGMTGQQALPG